MAGYYRIISLSTLPISWKWYRRWLLHKFGPLLISWMPMNWNEWSYSWIECSNEINSGWSLYFLGVIWQILQLMVRRSVKHRKNVKNLLTHALYSTGCRPPFCFHVVPLFSVFQFGFIIYYDFFFFFFTKKIKLHCVGFFFTADLLEMICVKWQKPPSCVRSFPRLNPARLLSRFVGNCLGVNVSMVRGWITLVMPSN